MIVYQHNSRFNFRIGSFDSARGYFIFPHVKSSYAYPWEAERDARRILKECPSLLPHLLVLAEESDAEESEPFDPHQAQSSEDMILSHYNASFDDIAEKTSGIKGAEIEDRQKVYDEIKIVVGNLLKVKEQLDEEESKKKIDHIIGRFSRLTKENFNDLLSADQTDQTDQTQIATNSIHRYLTASLIPLTKEEEQELLEDSATKVCSALANKFSDVCYLIDPKQRRITLVSHNRKMKYATLSFDRNMLLSSILPHSYLPHSNSGEFYQNIFKPIFQSIGHFKSAARKALMVSGKTALPDLTEDNVSSDVEAIDIETKQPCSLTISFNNKKWKTSRKTVKMAQITSRYTEMDYMNAMVQCVDQELESIYGHTGTVIQVIPIGATVYVDVDFGHAVIRLTESQIKIVS